MLPDSLKKNPQRVSELVSRAGLETVAVAVTFDPYTIKFTKEVNGKAGTLCAFDDSYEHAVDQVREIAKLCMSLGVTLAIHPHVRTKVETIQQVEDILDRCKNYSPTLVFDSAHFTALGWDLSNFIKRFGKFISVAHIKDLKELVSPKDLDYERDFVDIGDGVVDFPRFISELKKVPYKGWLIVEVDNPKEKTVAASISKNYKRLSNLMI